MKPARIHDDPPRQSISTQGTTKVGTAIDRRIEAARCARKFPNVLALVEEGAVTLTTVTLLAPHLTAENHIRVLDLARHKSKREVECIVAELRPAPDVPPTVRRLPSGRVAESRLQIASSVEVVNPDRASGTRQVCIHIKTPTTAQHRSGRRLEAHTGGDQA